MTSDQALPSPLAINETDIRLYFDFLHHEIPGEVSSLAMLNVTGYGNHPGYGTFHADVEEALRVTRREYAGSGATLHAVLGKTDLQGRKKKNMVSPRVWVLDLDRVLDRDEMREIVSDFSVELVVESSPGKFHLYWTCGPGVPWEKWGNGQMALAGMFDGDPNYSNSTSNLRVPGVPRLLKDGVSRYVPRVVWLTEPADRAYRGYDEMRALFDPDEWKAGVEYVVEVRKRLARESKERARVALSTLPVKYMNGGGHGNGANGTNGTNGVHDGPGGMAGGRNETLYYGLIEAIGEYRFLESGEAAPCFSREEVEILAARINEGFPEPLDAEEVEAVIDNAYGKGCEKWAEAEKRFLESCQSLNGNSPLREGLHRCWDGYDYEDTFLRENRFTDFAVMERVLQRFGNSIVKIDGGVIAFSESKKVWVRQSLRHAPELQGFIGKCALDTIHDPHFIPDLCINAQGDVSAEKVRRAQDRFLSLNKARYMLAGVMNSDRVREVSPDEFDADLNRVFLGNGVLDMQTGELRDPIPEDYLLRRSRVPWDSRARCPEWIQFLREVFANGDMGTTQAAVAFMQELFGYSLSGHISEQKLFCHLGGGSNGKSKILSALAAITGDYSTFLDPDDMGAKKGFSKPFERFGAKLEGRRVAIVDDLEIESTWNEAFVKNSTSPMVRARGEYEQSRVFANRCKMHLGMNVAPRPQAENFGLLRRLCIIPYTRKFEASIAASDRIDAMIRRELPGILVWAVEGFQRVIRDGITYPEAVVTAVEDYRGEHFPLETAIRELFERDEQSFLTYNEIQDAVAAKLAEENSMPVAVRPKELVNQVASIFDLPKLSVWDKTKKATFRGFALRLR